MTDSEKKSKATKYIDSIDNDHCPLPEKAQKTIDWKLGHGKSNFHLFPVDYRIWCTLDHTKLFVNKYSTGY